MKEPKRYTQKGNFFCLPNDIFDHDINQTEFMVLAYLVSKAKRNNQCYPSRATIAKKCKIKTMQTVDAYLKRLEEKHYIHKMYRFDHDEKMQLSNIYTIEKLEYEGRDLHDI